MTERVAPLLPQQQFGHNLRRLRLQSGISQEALALRCKRFKNQIPQIEDGAVVPTLTMIVLLAEALEVQPHHLLIGIGIGIGISVEAVPAVG